MPQQDCGISHAAPHGLRSARYFLGLLSLERFSFADGLLGLQDRPNRATNEDLVGGNTDDDLHLGKRPIRLDRQVTP